MLPVHLMLFPCNGILFKAFKPAFTVLIAFAIFKRFFALPSLTLPDPGGLNVLNIVYVPTEILQAIHQFNTGSLKHERIFLF